MECNFEQNNLKKENILYTSFVVVRSFLIVCSSNGWQFFRVYLICRTLIESNSNTSEYFITILILLFFIVSWTEAFVFCKQSGNFE